MAGKEDKHEIKILLSNHDRHCSNHILCRLDVELHQHGNPENCILGDHGILDRMLCNTICHGKEG